LATAQAQSLPGPAQLNSVFTVFYSVRLFACGVTSVFKQCIRQVVALSPAVSVYAQ